MVPITPRHEVYSYVCHRAPCDVILMPECACLHFNAVVGYCLLVYFRFSYALFCSACFVVVPCVLHMRPKNKPHCYNKPGIRLYRDLHVFWGRATHLSRPNFAVFFLRFTGYRWIPPTKPVTRSLMFCLICAWINGWVNSREAGDLRRHRSHYDVIVMKTSSWSTDVCLPCWSPTVKPLI